MTRIAPVVVRACIIGWIIADERKPFWASFVQCKTIDGRHHVSSASLLTSTMSLRPFSWLYLCLHWVVGAIFPVEMRGRGRRAPQAALSAFDAQLRTKTGVKNSDFRIEPLDLDETLHTDRRANSKNFFLLTLFRKKCPSWVFLRFFGFFQLVIYHSQV